MRKQLIFEPPDNVTAQEIKAMADLNNQAYLAGYPLYIFPGWEFEVVEVSEPMMIWNASNKIDKEEFVEATKKVRVNHE